MSSASYKSLVQDIADLPWQKANPADLILLSRGTAKEFAASLREARKLYPEDSRLTEMAEGELQTRNLVFGDYAKQGDHWEFLDFFIKELDIVPSSGDLLVAMTEYNSVVEELSPEDRAMTVFSREEELTLIFRRIVDAHDWDALGFGFYRYYLESHILFDSGEGGHHHLTKHFPLHEDVLATFYRLRLALYKSLFTEL